ncbi:MAG: PEGA domain-containing protein [bacterium]
MIGKTISHYKILEKLGEGGMGVVYKAEDNRLNRIVALKFLSQELTRDQEAKNRFIHEAQAASALDHPRIGTIYEIDETEDGQMFIAMAYYEGETLHKKLESRSAGQKIEEAIGIAIQIAHGLAKAHEMGIVHRDIKPANIIITKEGFVKIVDFGLAKLGGATRITKTGTTLGTPAYMSPEQVSSRETDYRSDIWSLGVILYELLTNQLPFKGEYEMSMLYSIVNEEPIPISQLNTKIPDDLERIINKALAKKVENRYVSMQELMEDLKKCHLSLTSKDQVSTKFISPSTKRKKIVNKIETGTKTKPDDAAMKGPPVIPPGKKITEIIMNPKTILTTALILILALLAITNSSKIQNIFKPDYGFLNVKSNPAGAAISLNGESLGAMTPKILRLKKGTYEVLLTLEGFESWSKDLTITKDDTFSESVQLIPISPILGTLIVKSKPPGASVFLDLKDTGFKTPAILESVSVGPHKIQLKKAGFQTVERLITISTEKVAEISSTLKKAVGTLSLNSEPQGVSEPLSKAVGSLFVDSEPQGALIYLNENFTGQKTPYSFAELTAGKYEVRLTSAGYVDKVTQVTITPNEEKRINIGLQAEPLGRLRVLAVIVENTSQKTAIANIFVDGEANGQTPRTISLKSGIYKISAKMFGYTSKNGEQQITIQSGEEATLKFVFFKNELR